MATEKRAKSRGEKARKPRWTRRNADKYALYEQSVYDPEADLVFLQRLFREEGRPAPLRLREDFAGTCKLAAMWVASHPRRTAVCLDLDPEPVAYGRERHLEPLGEAAARVDVRLEDVLTATTTPADIVTAFNFSYWCFKERTTLLRYFRRVRRSLRRDGVFVLDLQGGPDAQMACEEERRLKGFRYVWETESMDAITGEVRCWINFRFPDGSELRRAFEYDWRVWHLNELRDLLAEAGFAQIDVHWEGIAEDGEGDGQFLKTARAENEQSWIAYMAAWKTASAAPKRPRRRPRDRRPN